MNVTVTIHIEHAIAPETLAALENLIRAALPLIETGARPENGHVSPIETPEEVAPEPSEHVVYLVHDPDAVPPAEPDIRQAERPSQKACSVCGNPIARSSRSGHCVSCAMKAARAANPQWHLKDKGVVRVERHCACGAKIVDKNKSGHCRRCNLKHNRLNPTTRTPALQDIIREPEPVVAPTEKPAAAQLIKPFCAHDRDPDTCIHCAQMRGSGLDTTRPARDRKEDLKPARRRPATSNGRPLLVPEPVGEPDLVDMIEKGKP